MELFVIGLKMNGVLFMIWLVLINAADYSN